MSSSRNSYTLEEGEGRGSCEAMAAMDEARPAAVAEDAPPELGEDEFRHILRWCQPWSPYGTTVNKHESLRQVNRLFLRLWGEPATWAGLYACVPYYHGLLARSQPHLRFLLEVVMPSFARVASLDTGVLANELCGLQDKSRGRLLSQSRFLHTRSVNASQGELSGWNKTRGQGGGAAAEWLTRHVDSNLCIVDHVVARRKDPMVSGMAAVCGNGPVPRDAQGRRTFSVEVLEVLDVHDTSGIMIGFTSTNPQGIRFDSAEQLWQTATMWRLSGSSLNSNIPSVQLPGVRQGASLTCSFNQADTRNGQTWDTAQLNKGDVLSVTAQHSEGTTDGAMQITATLNGVVVVAPTLLVRCSFAMELYPYAAVCGKVCALRLVVTS